MTMNVIKGVESLATQISSDRLMQTVEHLDSIGIRFAGTPGEKEAADWIEAQFKSLNLSNIHQQEFPCLSFSYSQCELSARDSACWRSIPSEPAAHSKSTPKDGLEGELIYVEKIPEHPNECLALFEGRIALLQNSEFFEFSRFKKVMASSPLALLVVDDRFPNSWTVAVGFPKYWIDFISCPVVNISYDDAWKLTRDSADRVRLDLETTVTSSYSQNVIAEIPGTRLPEEVVVVSAHHDSVINNPGADDNCTGVAAVVELASVFSKEQPDRTLRFISYGSEEQLSEGARYYVQTSSDLARTKFVLNIDSIGAWMGKTGIYYCGPHSLRRFLDKINRSLSFPAQLVKELSPFSDHFPLNFAGVPAVWYYRTTFATARHYHHSRLETPEVVSPDVLRSIVGQQSVVLSYLINASEMPFPRHIPESQMKRLRQMAKDWCGIEDLESSQ